MLSNTPMTFKDSMLQDYFNIQPSDVKGQKNLTTGYYKRMLLNKIFSVYNFDIPDKRMLPWLRFWLFTWGTVAYFKPDDKLGWIFYPYSTIGLNYIYLPSEIEIVLNDDKYSPFKREVDKDAGIVYLVDDRFGIMDVVNKYAEMLAQCDKDININLMNSNVSLGAYANDQKEAQEIKTAYEKATSGDPLVLMNQTLLFDDSMKPFFKDVKGSFIANDLVQTRRSIMNAFLTEIGIRNSNYEKRERLTTSEVNENNDETRALVLVWYDNLKECFKRCAEISGERLDVTLNYEYINSDEIESVEEVEVEE